MPLIESSQLLKISNQKTSNNNILLAKILEIFIGLLDGDGYIEIGPQKQNNSNSTIRSRIVLRLHKKDKNYI